MEVKDEIQTEDIENSVAKTEKNPKEVADIKVNSTVELDTHF